LQKVKLPEDYRAHSLVGAGRIPRGCPKQVIDTDKEVSFVYEVAVTEPTNYMRLSKKITRQSRRLNKLKPV
jgi:hypothetical protein